MGNTNSVEDDEDTQDTQDTQVNKMEIFESIIYIIGHLFHIYKVVRKPIPPVVSDNERYEFVYNNEQFIQPVQTKQTPDPIVPQGGTDTVISDNDNVRPCVICLENEIKTVFLDCGHMALCLQCSRDYAESNPQLLCVICKEQAKQIKQIYSV